MLAGLVAMPLGMEAVARLFPPSGTFFPEDISTGILPLLLIQEEQFSVYSEQMYAIANFTPSFPEICRKAPNDF